MRISAYMSHPIRGEKGEAATRADMELNNEIAITVAQALRNALPCLDLYVPAENDEIITELYTTDKLGDGAILEADCTILEKRDIFISFEYRDVKSGGMRIEMEHAEKCEIPIFVFSRLSDIPSMAEAILKQFHESHS
jgi:hypothetical protein